MPKMACVSGFGEFHGTVSKECCYEHRVVQMNEMFSVVLTSAAVATLVGSAIDIWWQSRRHRSSTRFEALKVAVLLEGYAMACAKKISDHGTAVSSDGHAGEYMASVPQLPELQITAGLLQPKKASVGNALVVFPQLVEQAEQEAEFWLDVVGDIDCARNAATKSSGRLGLQSIELASQIRQAFSLPDRKLVFGSYDVKNTLKDAAASTANA